jgi:hypothetical protein
VWKVLQEGLSTSEAQPYGDWTRHFRRFD